MYIACVVCIYYTLYIYIYIQAVAKLVTNLYAPVQVLLTTFHKLEGKSYAIHHIINNVHTAGYTYTYLL